MWQSTAILSVIHIEGSWIELITILVRFAVMNWLQQLEAAALAPYNTTSSEGTKFRSNQMREFYLLYIKAISLLAIPRSVCVGMYCPVYDHTRYLILNHELVNLCTWLAGVRMVVLLHIAMNLPRSWLILLSLSLSLSLPM